jgi:serine/threonine protein phosphatase PrpC
MDHTPEVEMERFLQGQALNYSKPICRMSRWQLKVGEYIYMVSRSLEGQFATSKGVISDPDITTLQVQGVDTILVVASDGLWEVMDSQEVVRDVTRMKQRGVSAANAAKNLCAMALEKGSSDNVSVVVVYLE